MNQPTEDMHRLGLATRSIHCGEGVDAETKAVRRPIVLANSFKLNDDAETLAESFDWENTHKFNYPRSRHPNGRYLEERLAGMEEGEDCVVFASGVAAIAGAFFTLLGAGDHLISSRVCYIGIHELLVEHLAKRFGVEVSLVNTTDPAEVKAAVRPNTKLIHVETPANPTTYISDIEAIADIAKKAGAILSVDSTFSGLVTQKPLSLGADLVMHSLTKYVNGHGDGMGGAVIGRKDLITQMRDAASIHLGATISPFNAWLIMRSAVTLPLRMKKHCENGMQVARFLESHPKVKFVRYPGLPSHPQHQIAGKQMSGFGGMVSVELLGDLESAERLIRSTRFFALAESLGGVESLICHPATMTHASIPREERLKAGFKDELIRLSVGVENIEDLIEDLANAFKKI